MKTMKKKMPKKSDKAVIKEQKHTIEDLQNKLKYYEDKAKEDKPEYIQDYIESAKETFKERMEENCTDVNNMTKDELEEIITKLDEPHDEISEITDSSVPVYNSTLIELALNDLNLATDTPEVGPAFGGEATPVNIIGGNVYDRISQALFEYANELKKEYQDRLDNFGDDKKDEVKA
jgi:hypothetical protein